MCLGEVATSWGIGIITTLLLQLPTEKPVYPDMTPWTVFWASCMQYKLSVAFAGTDRTIYDGSIYFTVATSPSFSKYPSIDFFMNSPMAGSFLFPDASVSAELLACTLCHNHHCKTLLLHSLVQMRQASLITQQWDDEGNKEDRMDMDSTAKMIVRRDK